MQQARSVVAKEFEAVNQLIIEKLHSRVPLVENIGHYIVDAGGKRLRPMLALLSGGACGEISPQHITMAAVIEFIHTATLLHDDVVDISSLRRGRPTANANWGNAPSVLVGDFLYTRAFQLMVQLGNMQIMDMMAEVTNTIAEGEVLQLTKAGNPDTSEEDYYQVITDKTAVLFAAAAASGAILAGENEKQVQAFYQYGLHLGFAFQLIDDVLDYQGSAEEMGKNVGDDLSEGKPTLPLIYTMANGSPEEAELVRQAIVNKSNDKLTAIIQAVENNGAITYTRQQAEQYSQKALATLDNKLPDSPYKEALKRLAHLAVARNT
jgi:octaprenyl-diphosphate synthase